MEREVLVNKQYLLNWSLYFLDDLSNFCEAEEVVIS